MPSRKPLCDEESSMRTYEGLRGGHPKEWSGGWEVIEALEDTEDMSTGR